MAQTLSACRLGYLDEATWEQKEQGMHYTGHIPHVSLWSQRTQCGQLYAEHLLQKTCIEQRDKRKAGCGQDVQGKLRKGDTSVNRVRYLFVIAIYSGGGGRGGGYAQKNWGGISGPLPKTPPLFMAKICDFSCPMYDLSKHLLPFYDHCG